MPDNEEQDALLGVARKAANKMLAATMEDNDEAFADAGETLMTAFQTLDTWLARGEPLPTEWERRADNTDIEDATTQAQQLLRSLNDHFHAHTELDFSDLATMARNLATRVIAADNTTT